VTDKQNKEMRGAMFTNEKKVKKTQPDLTGTFRLSLTPNEVDTLKDGRGGVDAEMWLSGWWNTPQSGVSPQDDYLSVSLRVKEEQPRGTGGAPAAQRGRPQANQGGGQGRGRVADEAPPRGRGDAPPVDDDDLPW